VLPFIAISGPFAIRSCKNVHIASTSYLPNVETSQLLARFSGNLVLGSSAKILRVVARNPVEVYQRFGGTYRLHVQGPRVSQARRIRKPVACICKLPHASCWFLYWLTLRTWRWSQYVLPKLRWTSTLLHDFIFLKILPFTVTTVRTSYLTRTEMFFPDFPFSDNLEQP
jgi:hypothetical protein